MNPDKEMWDKCKKWGVAEIAPHQQGIYVYYDAYSYIYIPKPLSYMTIESVMWQGDHLIVRGDNGDNEKILVIYRDEFMSQIIKQK